MQLSGQWQQQGITFIPMVIEAHGGGWGRVARGVWAELAKSSALATGELQTEHSSAIMLRQRLSMTLHRENAHACLRASHLRCASHNITTIEYMKVAFHSPTPMPFWKGYWDSWRKFANGCVSFFAVCSAFLLGGGCC